MESKFVSRQNVLVILGAVMIVSLAMATVTFPAALIWIGQPLGNAAITMADAFASVFSVAFFAAFVLAMETAKTEFKTAMRRKIQALPQNLLASTKHGFSGEAPKDSICCVPHPMRTAQEQNR